MTRIAVLAATIALLLGVGDLAASTATAGILTWSPPLQVEAQTFGAVSSVSAADMIGAFRYVFGAAAALMIVASISMALMEERPLAGPAQAAELME